MSFLQQRLAALTDTSANLVAQLSELNRLRDRVRTAQLAARRSRRTQSRKTARSSAPRPDASKGQVLSVVHP